MKNDSNTPKADSKLGATLGFLTLRLWLSIRALVTGIEKYAGTTSSDAPVTIDGAVNTYGLTAAESGKVYGLDHYHGVPEALMSKFEAEPLIPSFALGLMDRLLGPALIIFGLTLLLGIATRISLFAMGIIYMGLTTGLILIKQDAGIAWLGVHILLVAFALFHSHYNRFAIMKKW
jgi:thiosulfate dehydrogenase [quinone] large subunit